MSLRLCLIACALLLSTSLFYGCGKKPAAHANNKRHQSPIVAPSTPTIGTSAKSPSSTKQELQDGRTDLLPKFMKDNENNPQKIKPPITEGK